jgi:hypothetical protein
MKPLESDEKIVTVMVYTHSMLARGELVAKESVRTSILLRTQGVPNYLHLHKPKIVLFGGSPPTNLTPAEVFIPTPSVIAFHIAAPTPPDEMDYDPTEAHRMMQPVDLIVGTFLLKGHLRLSSQAELGASLEVMRTSWLSIYDVNFANPYLPQFRLHVPMLVINPTQVSIGLA